MRPCVTAVVILSTPLVIQYNHTARWLSLYSDGNCSSQSFLLHCATVYIVKDILALTPRLSGDWYKYWGRQADLILLYHLATADSLWSRYTFWHRTPKWRGNKSCLCQNCGRSECTIFSPFTAFLWWRHVCLYKRWFIEKVWFGVPPDNACVLRHLSPGRVLTSLLGIFPQNCVFCR
jgi:hypothetical protein